MKPIHYKMIVRDRTHRWSEEIREVVYDDMTEFEHAQMIITRYNDERKPGESRQKVLKVRSNLPKRNTLIQ